MSFSSQNCDYAFSLSEVLSWQLTLFATLLDILFFSLASVDFFLLPNHI